MSIKSQIQQALQRFVAAGAGPFALDETAPTGRLTATVLRIDRLACEFDGLRVESPNLAASSLDDLKQRSQALCAKLSYLLEPIALVESDADSCATQLRSSPPAKEDDQSLYYEIVVRRGGSLEFRRYQKSPGDARQPLAATLTHEAFARLCEDLASAAG
jgi:hypothetical protein